MIYKLKCSWYEKLQVHTALFQNYNLHLKEKQHGFVGFSFSIIFYRVDIKTAEHHIYIKTNYCAWGISILKLTTIWNKNKLQRKIFEFNICNKIIFVVYLY